jgi:serine protease Do
MIFRKKHSLANLGILSFTLLVIGLMLSPFQDVSVAFTGSEKSLAPISFADLADKLMPSVVNISTTKKIKTGMTSPFGRQTPEQFFRNDELLKRFFGNIPEREYKQNALGSGFIISKDGYILTNNHVIDKVDRIKVKLSNGKEYDAVIIGKDDKTDLALIKIKPQSDLPIVKFGDSDRLRVGDWVVAIGNPFGLERTITSGIVSAKGRVIGAGPYDNFIQTDASINPGNSGGPLFNLSGEVVGVNTAIVARGQGIGFAIPVNTAKSIIEDLKIRGKVTRGWLGVSVQDVTEDIAQNLSLKESKGALVGDVVPGDPADRAGIRAGDILYEMDGKKIEDSHDLLRHVASLPIGKEIAVKAFRDGEFKSFKVMISERKDDKNKESISKNDSQQNFGFSVQEITPEIAQKRGISDPTGIIVTKVAENSPASDAGIKAGDLILQINKKRISSVKSFSDEIAKHQSSGTLLLLIKRGDRSFFVTLKESSQDETK